MNRITLTVSELIQALQTQRPDALVYFNAPRWGPVDVRLVREGRLSIGRRGDDGRERREPTVVIE